MTLTSKSLFYKTRKGPFKLFSPSMRRPNPIRSEQWNVIFLLFDMMADHFSFVKYISKQKKTTQSVLIILTR